MALTHAHDIPAPHNAPSDHHVPGVVIVDCFVQVEKLVSLSMVASAHHPAYFHGIAQTQFANLFCGKTMFSQLYPLVSVTNTGNKRFCHCS